MILSWKQRILSCKGTINKVYFMSYTVIFIVPIFIFGVSILFKNYATIKYFESSIDFYLIYFIVLFLGIGILILANLKKKKK